MKPILFNTAMVRAILDGEKTCTRRILKLPKHIEKQRNGLYILCAEGSTYSDREFKDVIDYIYPPYKVGDILYVRETFRWQLVGEYDFWGDCNWDDEVVEYKASVNEFLEEYGDYLDREEYESTRWIPSIHMPKDLARIFLKVTSVRAERLKDIDEEQAKKEGARKQSWYQPFGTKIEDEQKYVGSLVNHKINYKTGFADIWDRTVKEEKYSWEGNPWVWVIEFERVEKVEK
ncbi:hypothetical protein KCK52_001155 [Clostridium perfringens]|nr:hypothetical protein [Clostridium perfringens]